MNERNVAALVAILNDAVDYHATNRDVAEILASRGVLVPSAMTRRDWATLEGAVMWEYIGLDDLGPAEEANGRAALERIAKGEAP